MRPLLSWLAFALLSQAIACDDIEPDPPRQAATFGAPGAGSSTASGGASSRVSGGGSQPGAGGAATGGAKASPQGEAPGGMAGDAAGPAASAGSGGGEAGGEGGGDAGGAGGSDGGGKLCSGVQPPASAFGAAPAAIDAPSPGTGCPADRTCPGASMPRYALTDFQPQSCGFGATYGVDAFAGRTTLVALLASWCGYCQGQSLKLQQMALELEAAGKPVHIVIINAANAVDTQQAFVDRATYPLLQDTEQVNAWALHGGKKDDFYIYRSDGALDGYLPHGGETPTNLSTDEGYAAVKGRLEAAP